MVVDPRALGAALSGASRPLLALALLLLANAFLTPEFFQFEWRDGRLCGAPVDVVLRAAPIALAALGMALVLGTGGVDLSVGSVAAIAGVVAALCARDLSLSAPLSAAAGLAAGAAAGLFNAALVALVGVQPIVATLILFTAGRGVAQILSDGMVVPLEQPGLARLSSGLLLGLPLPVWLALGVGLALGLGLGRGPRLLVEALGDNPRAARLAGVPAALTLGWVYAGCGLLAALSGLIATADIKAADPANCGLYLELDAILAAVIGGTTLTGGRVRLAGTMVAALFLQTLTTTLLMHGLGYDAMLGIKAVAVLAVAALQAPRVRELWPARRPAKAAA